ncbi:hypothetical protein N7527_005003, partial [Penicillium freii]
MQLMLPFVTNGLAVRTAPRPDKHYVIMDNDWSTAEFMPCLIAPVGDVKQQLAAPNGASRGRNSTSCKSKHLSSLPGRNMAADQHAQPFPGIGNNNTPSCPGRGHYVGTRGDYPTSGSVQARLPDRPTGELAFGSELDGADGPQVSGQVSIYPAGVLTDIALAMRMDPQCASLAKDLVIMGGYVDLHLPADYQVR